MSPSRGAGPSPLRPRVVLLGASNLTRGFPTVLAAAHRALGVAAPDVFAALGHGRSYGRWSRVLHRGLPGIVDSGLWQALPASAAPVKALVTDIGNDLIYGASAEEISGWVEQCLQRLQAAGAEILLTHLPMASLRQLQGWQFRLLRTLLYPAHRIAFTTAQRRAEELDERLTELVRRFGVTAVEPAAAWYGPDRIHIRRRFKSRVWAEVLSQWTPVGGEAAPPASLSRLRWWTLKPARRTVFGAERRCPQPAARLEGGTRIWLY